jgi:hypothetical protein
MLNDGRTFCRPSVRRVIQPGFDVSSSKTTGNVKYVFGYIWGCVQSLQTESSTAVATDISSTAATTDRNPLLQWLQTEILYCSDYCSGYRQKSSTAATIAVATGRNPLLQWLLQWLQAEILYCSDYRQKSSTAATIAVATDRNPLLQRLQTASSTHCNLRRTKPYAFIWTSAP